MITEELLKIHDELEKRATSRPWMSYSRKRPGYGNLLFWSRRPDNEVVFDNENDIKYLAFIRNITPELVEEVRRLRRELDLRNT
jgi:hypothetical protein